MAKVFEIKKVATEWDGAWFCDKCQKMLHWKEKAYVDQDNGDKLCKECAEKRGKQDAIYC